MNEIYCLTCNHVPIVTSYDVNKLKEKQKFLIDCIDKDDTLTILFKNENEITYHTGIHYENDEYEIVKLEIL